MEGLAGVEERLCQHRSFALTTARTLGGSISHRATLQVPQALIQHSSSSSQPGPWGLQDRLAVCCENLTMAGPHRHPARTLIQMRLRKEVCLVPIKTHTVSLGQILMRGAQTIIWAPFLNFEFSLINLLHEFWCLFTSNSIIAMHFYIVTWLHSNLNATLKRFNYSKKMDFYNQPLEFLNRHK